MGDGLETTNSDKSGNESKTTDSDKRGNELEMNDSIERHGSDELNCMKVKLTRRRPMSILRHLHMENVKHMYLESLFPLVNQRTMLVFTQLQVSPLQWHTIRSNLMVKQTLALFAIVGPHGPSHGYFIMNAFRNDDLMVAS